MSNRLRLFTVQGRDDAHFVVRWMTGLDTKGVVEVAVDKDKADGRIVAELCAARWLLEEKNVCGHDKAGAGLEIYFSSGAVKKLQRGESSKQHLVQFAEFLWTRFLGASIDVENRDVSWADFECSVDIGKIVVGAPVPELISVTGAGAVRLTPYVVRRYVERFNRKPTKAWRELRDLLSKPELRRITIARRKLIEDVKHRKAAEYFFLPSHELVVVVSHIKMSGVPDLITAYRADKKLQSRFI